MVMSLPSYDATLVEVGRIGKMRPSWNLGSYLVRVKLSKEFTYVISFHPTTLVWSSHEVVQKTSSWAFLGTIVANAQALYSYSYNKDMTICILEKVLLDLFYLAQIPNFWNQDLHQVYLKNPNKNLEPINCWKTSSRKGCEALMCWLLQWLETGRHFLGKSRWQGKKSGYTLW